MSLVISEEYFQELAADCEDRDLNAVWKWLRPDCKDFEEAREAFFIVLRRLVVEGHVQLIEMDSDRPMVGTVDEQLEQFRKVFPKDDVEMHHALWFFDPNCPGGCNWKWKR